MMDEQKQAATPVAGNDDGATDEPGDIGDAAQREGNLGAPESQDEVGETREHDPESVRKAAEHGRKPI